MSKISEKFSRYMRRLINYTGYKVTMIDRRPFGEITMRFLGPRNFIGHIDNWLQKKFGE